MCVCDNSCNQEEYNADPDELIEDILMENVANIVGKVMERVMQNVMTELNRIGFTRAKWITLPCGTVGAPVKRSRWFLWAKHKSVDPRKTLARPLNEKEEEVKISQRPWGEFPLPHEKEWLLPVAQYHGEVEDRLRMLGNMVVPQQAWLAARLLTNAWLAD